MGIFTLSPANYQRDLKLFDDLLNTLDSIPHEAFVPSIINYAIFPLTHILQRNNPIGAELNSPGRIPDRILERLFECLTFLVERWKRTSTGIDLNMWEQLWTLSSLLLGGPLQTIDFEGGRNGKGPAQEKGKGRALSEETQLAVLGLMAALLDPISENMQSLDQDDDDDYGIISPSIRIHPTAAVLERLYASKMLPPILFHTVSTLLELVVPNTTPLEIQVKSLEILHALVTTYLKSKTEMLASVLPGLTSSLIKVFSSGSGGGKQVKERVALGSMGLFQDALIATLGDETLVEKGVLKKKVASLDDLVKEYGPNDSEAEIEISTDIASAPPQSSKIPRAFPDLTPQYLEFTSAQLVMSFKALLPALQGHSSPLVRKRLAELCGGLLLGCHRSLSALHGVLLGTLLQLLMDDHHSVAHQALKELRRLIDDGNTGENIRAKLKGVADQTLAGFPSAVMSQTEAKALASTRIITALCTLSMNSGSGGLRVFENLLGTKAGSQRWIWPLLTCLELGRAKEVVVSESGYAARAWEMAKLGSTYEYLTIEGSRTTEQGAQTMGIENPTTSDTTQKAPFPELSLKRVDSPTLLNAISGMFIALGKASGSRALDTVEHLITIARAKRNSMDVPKAATALWIAEQVMRGLFESPEGDSKLLRKEARSIVRMLVTFDEEDDADPVKSPKEPEREAVSDELVAVERKEGLNTLTNLLKRDHRGNKTSENETRSLHLKTHRELVTALSLSMMSACARILGSAFRPMLLETLYILLSHLGSPVAFIRGYAEIAILHIAYDIGYASPQNMIIDNVDYVINIVSQRMSFDRLSPLAPMVLISMIRLVGEPIVPLVQDIVDDIFDCLDSYHGYELLASTMLAVLDTLMRAMTSEAELAAWAPAASTSKRLRPGPDPKADFKAFQDWYKERAVKASQTVDSFLEPTPQDAWNRNGQEDGEEQTEDPDDPANAREEPEIPATRTQEVCKRIMEKDVFFMTHSSPFVRARVLSLFTNGIPVLVTGGREGDLLPLVNTAWPYILNRLRDSEPYVVTEAAILVEALAKWVGDFMSRRILENAWPILKNLLATQKRLDERSALAHRNAGGVASSFTVSHRLHLAIINMLAYVVEEVPVAESLIWEVIMLFRPFLDASVHQDQQDATVQLYRKIAKRDEDAVWLALRGSTGKISDTSGRLEYLRQSGLNIHDNVQRILPTI
jgi:hypothetical protein